MYHGLAFNETGTCVHVPGQTTIAPNLKVQVYPVVERHTFVWVWMGDTSQADPNLIPDLSMLDEQWRTINRGQLEYAANFNLINDNLLDLSHIAFVHETTLGKTAKQPHGQGQIEDFTPAPPNIPGGSGAKPIDRGVRIEGWGAGAEYRTILEPASSPNGDLWFRIDYLIPGIYISHSQMHESGTAERLGGQPPNASCRPLSDLMSIQAVTPIGKRRTRYFYSTGPRSAEVSDADAEIGWSLVQDAFQEDLRMIEAQQRNIDLFPGHSMGGIAADKGLVIFRSILKKMMQEEKLVYGGRQQAAEFDVASNEKGIAH
jgi:vanillate O-demethylase monooxygenase subunit